VEFANIATFSISFCSAVMYRLLRNMIYGSRAELREEAANNCFVLKAECPDQADCGKVSTLDHATGRGGNFPFLTAAGLSQASLAPPPSIACISG
jgi:hypothetical protein